MKQNYIGFTDSDAFLAAIDRTRPVNLSVSHRAGRADAKLGIAVDTTSVTFSQGNADEVLYFQHVTQRYQVIGGQVMDADDDRPRRLAAQVLEVAKEYLRANDIKFRPALLSMPKNYVALDGHATFLRYYKETDSFQFKAASHEIL